MNNVVLTNFEEHIGLGYEKMIKYNEKRYSRLV